MEDDEFLIILPSRLRESVITLRSLAFMVRTDTVALKAVEAAIEGMQTLAVEAEGWCTRTRQAKWKRQLASMRARATAMTKPPRPRRSK